MTRLNGLYEQTLGNAGVTVLRGRAMFAGPHSVAIGGQTVTAGKVLIATGAWPVFPDCPGADLGISSNEAFHLPELPQRIIIAGGGYIATEFAGIFHGLGSEVTQLYRGHLILKAWDEELRERIQAIYQEKGIKVHTHAIFESIEKTEGGLLACLSDGSRLEADVIMHAIGRKPNTMGLGLEKAGVATGNFGVIKVDRDARTNVPHIFAVGDVTDRIQLTPVAIKEGHAFADREFGGKSWHVDYDCVGSAVFSQPALASVGLTEAAAREHGEVHVYRSDFRPMKNTISGRNERSLCKLIVDAATDRIVGAHMLGPEAPELIQILAVAMKMGATKAQFDATVAVHPTAAEEFVLMR